MKQKEKDIQIFKVEISYFTKMHQKWLNSYENQYVLIKEKALIGTYPTLEEAYSEGISHFGNDVFFVKQVLRHEPPEQLATYFANALSVRF